MRLQLSHFRPFTQLHPAHTLPPTFPLPYSSCSWVILISSLASTFPTLFLPSPCLFSTYHLCYLFSVPFPPFSPPTPPNDNLPCDLHFCDSVPVLVVCLVCFCFCFFFLGLWKSKDLHPRLLYPAKLSFRMGGQIKCFPDKVKLKEFIITKPLL